MCIGKNWRVLWNPCYAEWGIGKSKDPLVNEDIAFGIYLGALQIVKDRE